MVDSGVCEDCESSGEGLGPFLLLLLPVLLSLVWVVFQLLYGSWLLALLLTKLVNLFLKDSGIYIGSIHVNFLTRRVVFKHLHYYCRDYSIRVANGYAGVSCCKSCCCSSANSVQQAASMCVQLDGFEYHWYNKSEAYDHFGKSPDIHGPENLMQDTEDSSLLRWWKATQPSLHFSIKKGRVVMGNHHLERSLVVQFEQAEARYSTAEASNPYDELLHCVDVMAASVTVDLQQSAGYSGPTAEVYAQEENMQCFLLLQTDSAHLVYSQDSPGLVPLGTTSPPKFEFAATLGDRTVINYGCCANRHRRQLYSFFFPNDHLEQAVSRMPQAGERRRHTVFDITVSLGSSAQVKLPFSYQHAMHMLSFSLGPQSRVTLHIPWVTVASGSVSSVEGHLEGVSIKSSLPYPHLASAAVFSFQASLAFPRVWNGVQKWDMKFRGQKVQVNILFAYIDFVNALLDDWTGNEPSDLLDFVPVDWTIGVDLEQYEIFLLVNRCNWLDLSAGGLENTRLAFCGSTGHISLGLPFTEFLPLKQMVHFLAVGEDVVVRHYAPPSTATRESLFALSAANRFRWRILESRDPSSSPLPPQMGTAEASSELCGSSSSCNQSHTQASLPSSDSESERELDQLLTRSAKHIITSPIIGDMIPLEVFPRHTETPPTPICPIPSPVPAKASKDNFVVHEFFPMGCRAETLYERGWLDIACGPTISIDIEYTGRYHDPSAGSHTPNTLTVDVDVPQALIRAFGCLAGDLQSLKENYPGEYIKMTTFSSNVTSSPPSAQEIVTPPLSKAPPPAPYDGKHEPEEPTTDILVNFKLRNVTAEFPVDMSKDYPLNFPLPSLCTDVLRVQVEYVAMDTIVCLHVDPLSVNVPSVEDVHAPLASASPCTMGHVVINAIDLNCHGFTEFMCQERVEYAWMMQLLIGRVTGAVSPLQLVHALDWLYTAGVHIAVPGDGLLLAPDGEMICPRVEPISEEIKYRLFQVDLSEADLHVCEGNSVTRLQCAGFDLELCTLHKSEQTLGMSWQLHSLTVTALLPNPQSPAVLLEVGLLDVSCVRGGLEMHAALDCVPNRQVQFLCDADKQTQRLWFLWSGGPDVCGCYGGCQFLGGSIGVRPLCMPSESAVYGPQFTPLPSIPRHLGLQGLSVALQDSSMDQLCCLWTLHRNLLDHYNLRYAGHRITTHLSDHEARSSRYSESEIFQSARSSLTSLAEKFVSLEDVNASSMEAEAKRKGRHRKNPSNLSTELRVTAGGREAVDGRTPLQEAFVDLVPSYDLHSAAFQISSNTPTQQACPEAEQATPPPSSLTPKVSVSQHLHLYLPCVRQLSKGSLPVLTLKGALYTHTQERRRRPQRDSWEGPSGGAEQSPQFSVFLSINGTNTLRLSPPFLDILDSVLRSVASFFAGRSAMSVLNTTSFATATSVSNLLASSQRHANLLASTPPTCPADKKSAPPLLCFHLNMSQAAFVAIQLLQNAVPRKSTPMGVLHGQLEEIVPHNSLLTLYLSGTSASLLLHVLSEADQSATSPINRVVNSVKLAGKLKCPVVQVNFSALVPAGHRCEALPGLVHAQQQLDFNLSPSLDGKPDFDLCDLLEAGLKDTSLSVAASIVTSKLDTDAILSWEHVNTSRGVCLDRHDVTSDRSSAEGKRNMLSVDVSVPLLWSQLAAPQCGLAQPSSGGLDLLILSQALSAWEGKVHAAILSLTTLAQAKARRDQQVLLTLISNTARSQCVSKPFSPVLNGLASAFRKTVWFSCSQQLWNSLCLFSEHSVPQGQDEMERSDVMLVAATMALVSRLYSSQGQEVGEKLLVASKQPPSSIGILAGPPATLDFLDISINSSPPIGLHTTDLDGNVDLSEVFSQMDRMTLVLLRESLLPFFSASGISLKQQLRNTSAFKAKFSLDFTIEMREATLFVLDYLQSSSGSSYLHTQSTAATPALFLDQLLLQGNVEHSAELEPSKTPGRFFPLLPVSTPTSPTKVGVVSNCCAKVETVRASISTPLLKLAKHISMTGKFRRKLLKQAKLAADEELLTPCPPLSATPPSAPPPCPVVGMGYVANFALAAVQEMSDFEGQAVSPAGQKKSATFSSPASHAKLMDFVDCPKPLKSLSQPQSDTRLVHLVSLDSSAGVVPGDTLENTYHSSTSLSSMEMSHHLPMNVSITLDYGTSPEDMLSTAMDTCGEDTTDSLRMFSSDNEELRGSKEPVNYRSQTADPSSNKTLPTRSRQTPMQDPTQCLGKGLELPQTDLLFSIFGLLKCGRLQCELQVETTRASLELSGISASVDTRNSNSSPPPVQAPPTSAPALSLLAAVLPTYLSVAATLKSTVLRVSDRGLPESDLLQLLLQPACFSIGISNCRPDLPTYRCLLKLTSLNMQMKQSAVKVHKRFQQLMPAFTRIYNDIFGQKAEVMDPSLFSEASASEQTSFSMENVVKIPAKMPLGFFHFCLDKTLLYVAPLPSLTLTHTVSPLSFKAQTAQVMSFQLIVGEHTLRFNPKEQFKNELSLRSLSLPYLYLKGTIRRSKKKKIPQLSLDLFIKQVNIDLTTDVLNQLLVVQNSFVKEVNDLLQMLTSVGEAIPHRDRLPSLEQNSERAGMDGLSTSDSWDVQGRNLNLVALLESCRFSLAGIVVTVSTPLATAIRFSTGKIEMTLMNTSSQSWQKSGMPSSAKQQLSLDGRVDIDMHLALGYLQAVGPDVVDDLCELAYFSTRVTVRNTLQNLYGSDEQPGGRGEMGTAVDTFLIFISSPHLYLQSSAVEQAILFWLNCKSVYSYWQNERKLLNVEVMRATEAFMEKINRPAQFQTSSIDFSKPRLVQITVSDVGACMPIIPVSCDNSTPQQFPALVVTIKEMQFLLNLSHKVASIGHFQTFCIRFAEKFFLRQRIWTLDPRKHKFTNFGTITCGTFRLCIASKKRFSENNPSEVVGEKLVSAFQWDMSGIIINANTDIGHHTSTLVHTMTTIASDLDGKGDAKGKPKIPSPKSQSSRLLRKNPSMSKGQHRRSLSMQRSSQVDNTYKTALEQELAQHTRTVQKLKLTGAATDSLRSEEDLLRSTQQELARTVQRIFRHPRTGISLQKFNQLFFSTSDRHLPTALRGRMFSVTEEQEGEEKRLRGVSAPMSISSAGRQANPMLHRRHTSDVTGMRVFSPSPSPTPPPEDDGEEDGDTATSSLSEDKEALKKEEHGGFSMPSISLEFDITVNVDHGKIVLRTEESSVLEWRHLHSALLTPHSPGLPTRKKSEEPKHVVESVVLIPALTVRAHYQSFVGPSYCNLSSFRPPGQPSSPDMHPAAAETAPGPTPRHKAKAPGGAQNLPMKRGVLSLSAVVESLPEHIKLTPSLLEFIEQVAQPTLAAAAVSSFSSSDSISNAEEAGGGGGGRGELETVQTTSPISFPVDVTLTFNIQPSTVYLSCQPYSQVECTIQSPNVNFVISFSLFSQQMSDIALNSSGAPLTSSSRTRVVPFNKLYVTGCLSTFALQLYSLKHGATAATEGREALSLTLGHALFHLSRNSVSVPAGPPLKPGKKPSCVEDCHTHNKLHVSVIMNVASLVLGYDMRRLNDITAFRRFWYRTSLVEALFIGSKKEQEDESSALVLPPSAASTNLMDDTVSGTIDLDNSISAAIVLAASIDDFRVAANFAQVMGNADLLVSDLKCQAHCDVSHNELVLLQLDGKLDKGEFDARAGVIAGSLLVENAVVDVLTQSQQGSTPEHRGKAALSLMEGRVDYMGSCILLARATELKVDGNDLWEGLQLNGEQQNREEDELASIQVKAQFSWQELQLAIHRSTTQHVFNIVEKLDEFITQQKKRSERTLSNMLPAGFAVSKALQAYRKEKQRMATTNTIKEDSRHHWLWAVKVWSMELMQVLGIQAPVDAHHEVSLGGIIGIAGESLCIVCFHGPSFRERERAVFTINRVQASFSTQAIPGLGRWQTEATTHLRTCQQIVKLCLDGEGTDKCKQLASIHRVSTGRSNVPNIAGSTIREWLAYACVDTFLHEDNYSSDSSTLVRLSRKLSVQQVLLVPAFTVSLINDHFWPQLESGIPKVECTLTSSFSDGISVTTTVDHYLFLHDIVRGYIDYLEKHRLRPATFQPSASATGAGGQEVNGDAQLPGRHFECVCWELNPHLCLLTAVSGQFNPHISWLLERLGFKHAQTTIPKWIQRGAMDPLDKVIAAVVELLIKLTASKKKNLMLIKEASSAQSYQHF